MLKDKEQFGSRPSYTLWEPDFVGSREALDLFLTNMPQSSGARIIRFRAVPRKPRSLQQAENTIDMVSRLATTSGGISSIFIICVFQMHSGETSAQLLAAIPKPVSETKDDLWFFIVRLRCVRPASCRDDAGRFRPGYSIFFGPGSEETWKSNTYEESQLSKKGTGAELLHRFCKLCRILPSSPSVNYDLQGGTLRKNGSKDNIHVTNCDSSISMACSSIESAKSCVHVLRH